MQNSTRTPLLPCKKGLGRNVPKFGACTTVYVQSVSLAIFLRSDQMSGIQAVQFGLAAADSGVIGQPLTASWHCALVNVFWTLRVSCVSWISDGKATGIATSHGLDPALRKPDNDEEGSSKRKSSMLTHPSMFEPGFDTKPHLQNSASKNFVTLTLACCRRSILPTAHFCFVGDCRKYTPFAALTVASAATTGSSGFQGPDNTLRKAAPLPSNIQRPLSFSCKKVVSPTRTL